MAGKSVTGIVTQKKRKGWFVIPGVQDGDRTLEEQSVALQPALDNCAGATVFDMGCAEGLVAYEFAKRGAAMVMGWDVVKDHIYVARRHFEHPNAGYRIVDLNDAIKKFPAAPEYDIVLALGVVHKLWDVPAGLRWAAAHCRKLLLLRSGVRACGGKISSKHNPTAAPADIAAILTAAGFELEKTVDGGPKFKEAVDYWRRVRS